MPKIPTKRDISNDLLINAMRVRPALYAKNEEKNGSTTFRKKLWHEVCRDVFPKVWDSFTPYQCDLAVIEVQMRWKNLRNSYTRELRLRKLDEGRARSSDSRKPYLYFNDLSFLDGNVTLLPNNDESNDNMNTYLADEDFSTYENIENQKEITPEYDNIDVTIQNIENQKEITSEYGVTGQNIQSEGETDAATHFAMSLIPFIKAVPPENKIDCEIMVLKVLKKYAKRSRVQPDDEDPLKSLKVEFI